MKAKRNAIERIKLLTGLVSYITWFCFISLFLVRILLNSQQKNLKTSNYITNCAVAIDFEQQHTTIDFEICVNLKVRLDSSYHCILRRVYVSAICNTYEMNKRKKLCNEIWIGLFFLSPLLLSSVFRQTDSHWHGEKNSTHNFWTKAKMADDMVWYGNIF